MKAFLLSLGMVFIAELGDKTQLVSLTLACRFNARTVLAGVLAATLVVHLFSVGLGDVAGRLLPTDWVSLTAGAAFVIFGLWTLRGDSLGGKPGGSERRRARSPFWIVATAFFIAELGDKTMLSTVTLATSYSVMLVWIGSSLGMVLSDALAIWVGHAMGRRLPERAVKIGASTIFFAFGILSALRGASNLPATAWLATSAVTAVIGVLILARRRPVSHCPELLCSTAGDTCDHGSPPARLNEAGQ